MNNQWPLFAAMLLIALATGLGLYQREEAISGATPNEIARPLPAPSVVTIAERTAVTPAVTAPPTNPGNPANPVLPKRKLPPAERPPVGEGAAPVTPVATGANPRPRGPGRFQVLLDLQEDLKTRLQMVPIPMPNGGYKFSMEGAHLEVVTTPSWMITLYNINPKQPEVETDGFKTLLAAVVSVLGINTNTKPVEAATGKSYLRTVSKMGNISLERDPASGNSAVIRPMTPTPAVDVAQPPQVPVTTVVKPQPVQPPTPGPAQPVDNSKKPAADF